MSCGAATRCRGTRFNGFCAPAGDQINPSGIGLKAESTGYSDCPHCYPLPRSYTLASDDLGGATGCPVGLDCATPNTHSVTGRSGRGRTPGQGKQEGRILPLAPGGDRSRQRTAYETFGRPRGKWKVHAQPSPSRVEAGIPRKVGTRVSRTSVRRGLPTRSSSATGTRLSTVSAVGTAKTGDGAATTMPSASTHTPSWVRSDSPREAVSPRENVKMINAFWGRCQVRSVPGPRKPVPHIHMRYRARPFRDRAGGTRERSRQFTLVGRPIWAQWRGRPFPAPARAGPGAHRMKMVRAQPHSRFSLVRGAPRSSIPVDGMREPGFSLPE